MKQRMWPRHCVQDSWGAELHKDLKVGENAVKVYKGTNSDVDSYSVFWDNKKLSDTTLNAQLKIKGTSDIYVCGLAYDVCVGATAIDAISAGYRTILIDDCCRGVDLKDIEHTKETVISNNGIIAHSKEVSLKSILIGFCRMSIVFNLIRLRLWLRVVIDDLNLAINLHWSWRTLTQCFRNETEFVVRCKIVNLQTTLTLSPSLSFSDK